MKTIITVYLICFNSFKYFINRKATFASVIGHDTKMYLTPVEKNRLHQKTYQERKSASVEFQQRERARANWYYSDPTNSQKREKRCKSITP